MSFLEKIQFWKKDDDFSFDETNNLDSEFNKPFIEENNLPPKPDHLLNNEMENNNFNPQNNFSENNNNNNQYNNPGENNQVFSQPIPPPPDYTNQTPSLGQSLAKDYIASQEQNNIPPTTPPRENIPPQENNKLEMVNLKIDSIKSEINSINQRLQRIEQLIIEQNKKKGW